PLTVDHDSTICGVPTEPEFVRVPRVEVAAAPGAAPYRLFPVVPGATTIAGSRPAPFAASRASIDTPVDA
ncbi:MAG: hypothetical protein H7287_00135, partial [Thermoleophilia bacterium]|nr:hypothetical protein [Thermoleophilia bacterium]